MEFLPEDCIAHVLSHLSPRDVCRSAAVASEIRNAAESEVVWDAFLPPDHQEIISRSVYPLTFKSKKKLFFKISTPLLIDGGLKTFSIYKATGKICYMLSARDLFIAWSTNSLFWCWKLLPQSRFSEAVEFRMTSWLEIEGKINTRTLSKNTHYGAYLNIEVAHYHAYGLDILPYEVSTEVGGYHTRGKIILCDNQCNKCSFKRVYSLNYVQKGLRSKFGEEIPRVCHQREDGWLEIELGEFYNDEGCEKKIKVSFRDVNCVHLKWGLSIERIDIRPL